MKRLKIINETGIGAGTHLIDAETGAEVHGILSFSVHCDGADSLIMADVKIALVEIEIDGRARFLAEDSDLDGRRRLREVSKIIWADGGSTDYD